MNIKSIALLPIAATLYLSAALPVYANPVPEFGSCLNPQWSKTQENTGLNHGVVGVGTFAGTDSIYSSNGNVMQCLCAENGRGYQTNWLKADTLSSTQKDELKAQGWTYVPFGEEWGLEKTAYLAKNVDYTCTACTPTPTPTGTITPTPTGVPGPTPTATPQTRVEGASANNTTLAATGTARIMAILFFAGALSLIVGMILKRARRNKKV